MITNNLEIEINASIEKVWLALTNANEFHKWMKRVTVATDWKQGSEIIYTCYDETGKVMQWEGMEMIWQGSIKTIRLHKELTCIYPSQSTGLIEESYLLEKLDGNKTKLLQIQIVTTQAVADGYKDGTLHSLQLLKNHLESMSTKIKVSTTVNAPIAKVWACYTQPEHITNWNFASDDWLCPRAENDLRVGGKYSARMEAKDGSFGFDFEAIYTKVEMPQELTYTMADGRIATTSFETIEHQTLVSTTFDPENENPAEMQQQGWQMILNNFKKYTESVIS